MNIIKYTKELKHLANAFTCGNIVIDNFLKSNQSLDPNIGVTYILLSDDETYLIGYYNIVVGRVDQFEMVGNSFMYSPMGGSIHINYLAIDINYQHMALEPNGHFYFGDLLLRDCEARIVALQEKVGVQFVTLGSTNEGYHMYHDRNNYDEFDDDMSSFEQESDVGTIKLYKCIDDIIL